MLPSQLLGRVMRLSTLATIAVLLVSTRSAAQPDFSIADSAFQDSFCEAVIDNDPAGDVTSDHRDIIGNSSNSGLSFTDDGTFLYARMRVTDSPASQSNTTICSGSNKQMKPFGWGILLDVDEDGTNYEVQILLKGTGNNASQQVYLRTNGANRVANPGSVTDSAEDPPDDIGDTNECPAGKTCEWQFDPCTHGHFKDTGVDLDMDGTTDWFVTFAIPLATLVDAINQIPGQARTLPLSGRLGLWGGTSSSGNTLNTDNTCLANSNTPATLSGTAGDPLFIGTYVSITSPGDGATVTTATPTLSGESEPGADVELTIGDGTNSTSSPSDVTRDSGTGAWSYDIPAGWGYGHGDTKTITVTADDGDATSSEAVTITVSTCGNGVKDGLETDVDCGGGVCGTCDNGESCNIGADCTDGSCVALICQAAGCNDMTENGDETDVDCGGPACAGCPDGDACLENADCISGSCDTVTTLTCLAPTCSDSVENGSETDVDCGGSCPQDCDDGEGCITGSDCASGVCSGNICQAPTCSDGVLNGTETDTDCGGSCPDACDVGEGCAGGSDCVTGVCTGSLCQAPSCGDGVKNGSETDVDCGGSCPQKCDDTEGCAIAGDCLSDVCIGSICQPPTCSDGARNGDETDVDCGGSCPDDCDDGEACLTPGDCISKVCTGNI